MSEGELVAWLHVGSAGLIGTIGLFVAIYRSYSNEKQFEEEMEQLREDLAREQEERRKRLEQQNKEFQERRKQFENKLYGRK
jgi:predicted histidine transporter YuiF (NhaC family)